VGKVNQPEAALAQDSLDAVAADLFGRSDTVQVDGGRDMRAGWVEIVHG